MTATDRRAFERPYGWDSHLLDLGAYLRRIGYEGSLDPTLDTLRALNTAHAVTFPFENLDVMAGLEPRLDLEGLQDKMVRRRRGGYCYEQNTLFAAVLERLGFNVTGLNARVMDSPDSSLLRATGHAAIKVDLDGREWFTDVGVGDMGPLEPLELVDGYHAVFGAGWRYQIKKLDFQMWAMREWNATEQHWVNIHRFALAPSFRVDYVDANYIAAHHPRSPFRKSYVLARNGQSAKHGLTGLQLKTKRPDGTVQNRTLEPKEVPDAMGDLFDLQLNAAERSEVIARVKPMEPEELTAD
ncbi:arylamine N-acetyltransferase family protein [Natronoglycomyces albus]|uniref:Arylamine N-acetyltransferase n=1 Tax=Natronoglycomyces albus TaxID=2811108 RepID=A0A895XPG6_9ACTN|nr:arylamine N-acetyltransferase [Natronoglycomyces albus]QSB04985.1 arylamine N-acetyltransferase [Natronoglycomyces albus]